MATHAKEIKNRLQSIKNTKKITKAMELVSGAKMRKAVTVMLNTRAYYRLAWEIMTRITKNLELASQDQLARFFELQEKEETENQRVTLVVFTSNRGLAGAFNTNVIKKIASLLQKYGKENIEVIAVGKKGVAGLSLLGIKAHLAYLKDDTAVNSASISVVARLVHEKFKKKETDKVLVAYTDYLSAINQEAIVKQLYPFTKTAGIGESVENMSEAQENKTPEKTLLPSGNIRYTYEPSKEAILTYLIPRIAEVQLYQALLESNASEHSARMVAMKNASDAASEMSEDLTLAFNRARQASITQEIAEISAGTAAI